MTQVLTGNGISLYRYSMLQAALKLEAKGMRHSGGSIRARIAQELNLKKSAPREDFIAKLEEKKLAIMGPAR